MVIIIMIETLLSYSSTIPYIPIPEVVDDLGEVEVAGEGPGHVLAHARRSLESGMVFADYFFLRFADFPCR